jgi:hypothetical protein
MKTLAVFRTCVPHPVGFRILGLDPANRCGWCWSDGRDRKIGVWILKKTASDGDGLALVRLRDHLLEAANTWGLDLLAYEDAAFC